MVAQNIGSSKRFRGIAAIKGVATLRHWLGVLAVEICERIEQYASENQQRPASLTVSFAQADAAPGGKSELSSSRTVPLSERAQTDAEQLAADALDVIRRNTVKFFRAGQTGTSVEAGEPPSVLNNAILFLGISVGKFQAVGAGDDTNTIRSMFSVQANKQQQQQKRLSAESDRRPQTVEVHTVDQGMWVHLCTLLYSYFINVPLFYRCGIECKPKNHHAVQQRHHDILFDQTKSFTVASERQQWYHRYRPSRTRSRLSRGHTRRTDRREQTCPTGRRTHQQRQYGSLVILCRQTAEDCR